jgi:hypothetical protein
MKTVTLKRTPSAWLVILNRTRSSKIPSEKKKARVKENGNKQATQSVHLTFCSGISDQFQPSALVFYNIMGSPTAITLSVSIQEIKLICFIVVFWSFRNVTPNYNIMRMGTSDSHYAPPPGT